MSLPEVDPVSDIGYAQDAHKLIAAGFEFQPGECGGGTIHSWRRAYVRVYAALDRNKMAWLFRAKGLGPVPSPTFDTALALITWMRVEGWLS